MISGGSDGRGGGCDDFDDEEGEEDTVRSSLHSAGDFRLFANSLSERFFFFFDDLDEDAEDDDFVENNADDDNGEKEEKAKL
mmetsp:Transcript_40594/g.59337  ORF Transcript_40594/g.59337 Transcript_40594/m.59337 type:complete len:82 (-) Transcript_40594:38-283(-)